MAQGIRLLQLVLPLAVAVASVSVGTKGSTVGETSNSFSPSVALLDFDYSFAENKLQREHQIPHEGDVAASQNSFMSEAYAAKWSPPYQQSHGDDVAASQSSFMSEAYAVKWSPPYQQSHGDVDEGQSSFIPEAYEVKWSPPYHQSQGNVDEGQNSFTPEAHRVVWNQASQPHVDVAARKNSMKPAAYPVTRKQQTHVPDVADATPARGHGLHVEPGMLFTRKSMFPGAVLPEGTKFADTGFPSPRRFVSRADADAIPFSYEQLDTVLRMFQIPRGAKKANQVAATLLTCEAESPDPHTCATSQQAAAEFAASSLGVRTSELLALTTVVHGKEDTSSRYTVAPDGVARIGKAGGASSVPCHPMAYPYMVHYCHRPVDVEALRVELMGLGDTAAAGDAITTMAIAMCHTNTASWDARYFEMLNATRGEEICHFMPRNYVLWLPAAYL